MLAGAGFTELFADHDVSKPILTWRKVSSCISFSLADPDHPGFPFFLPEWSLASVALVALGCVVVFGWYSVWPDAVPKRLPTTSRPERSAARVGQRKFHFQQGTAEARRGADAQRALILPGNLAHDGQPQTAAITRLPGGAIETLTDAFAFTFRYSRAVIFDAQPPSGPPGRNRR